MSELDREILGQEKYSRLINTAETKGKSKRQRRRTYYLLAKSLLVHPYVQSEHAHDSPIYLLKQKS